MRSLTTSLPMSNKDDPKAMVSFSFQIFVRFFYLPVYIPLMYQKFMVQKLHGINCGQMLLIIKNAENKSE